MEIFLKVLLNKFFDPAYLTLPSPSLPPPASWLIPMLLYLAILSSAVSLIRKESMMWLWGQMHRLMNWLCKMMMEALTFSEPRPIANSPVVNLLGNFAKPVFSLLGAIYFLALGLTALLLAAPQKGKTEISVSLAALAVGMGIILVGRIYLVSAARARRKLADLWTHYPGNRNWAVVAVMAFTGLLCTAFWAAAMYYA